MREWLGGIVLVLGLALAFHAVGAGAGRRIAGRDIGEPDVSIVRTIDGLAGHESDTPPAATNAGSPPHHSDDEETAHERSQCEEGFVRGAWRAFADDQHRNGLDVRGMFETVPAVVAATPTLLTNARDGVTSWITGDRILGGAADFAISAANVLFVDSIRTVGRSASDGWNGTGALVAAARTGDCVAFGRTLSNGANNTPALALALLDIAPAAGALKGAKAARSSARAAALARKGALLAERSAILGADASMLAAKASVLTSKGAALVGEGAALVDKTAALAAKGAQLGRHAASAARNATMEAAHATRNVGHRIAASLDNAASHAGTANGKRLAAASHDPSSIARLTESVASPHSSAAASVGATVAVRAGGATTSALAGTRMLVTTVRHAAESVASRLFVGAGRPARSTHRVPDVGLPAGTRVRIPSGSKPIEELHVGDLVMTTALKEEPVVSIVEARSSSVFALRFKGRAETVPTTLERPFWSFNARGWVRARDIREGDTLRTMSGPVVVESFERVPGVHKVYNFEVASKNAPLISDHAMPSRPSPPDLYENLERRRQHVGGLTDIADFHAWSARRQGMDDAFYREMSSRLQVGTPLREALSKLPFAHMESFLTDWVGMGTRNVVTTAQNPARAMVDAEIVRVARNLPGRSEVAFTRAYTAARRAERSVPSVRSAKEALEHRIHAREMRDGETAEDYARAIRSYEAGTRYLNHRHVLDDLKTLDPRAQEIALSEYVIALGRGMPAQAAFASAYRAAVISTPLQMATTFATSVEQSLRTWAQVIAGIMR